MRRILQIYRRQEYDFPYMIENCSYMLKPLTINIDSRNTKRLPLIVIIIMALMTLCNIYVFMVSMMWYVFWRCPTASSCDLITAVVNFSLGLASTTGCAKLIFILLYHDTVKSIVDGYMASDALVVPGSRFSSNLVKTLTEVKKRIMMLWIILLFNCVSFVVLRPTIRSGTHLLEDKQVLLGLEPMFESPNYELSVIVVGVAVVYINYVCICTCTLFMTMTGYSEAQMVALSIELINLWDDAQNHYLEETMKRKNNTFPTVADKNKILNEYVHHHLIDIIKRHTVYVSLLRRLESIFRGALVTEFVLLITGLIAELLGGLEHTYLQVPFTFIQAGIDCWTGQLLINASEMFEKAVYNCKWENFDNSNMRMVLLMLLNSQRTLKLSAGGIATLSFSCLMSIIKSIFSAYTTLRTTMHK